LLSLSSYNERWFTVKPVEIIQWSDNSFGAPTLKEAILWYKEFDANI
jgi:hypothetical protein